jgi:hypothetical protein
MSLPGEAADGGASGGGRLAGSGDRLELTAAADGSGDDSGAIGIIDASSTSSSSNEAAALAAHKQLAGERDLYSFCASAARREQVTAILSQLAADLAGLPRPRQLGRCCDGEDDQPQAAASAVVKRNSDARLFGDDEEAVCGQTAVARFCSSVLRSLAARFCCFCCTYSSITTSPPPGHV